MAYITSTAIRTSTPRADAFGALEVEYGAEAGAMSEKLTLTLHNEQQGHQAIQTVWKHAKAQLSAAKRMVLTLRPETRSDAQNNLLHSRISDVSKHCQWAGEKLDIEDWKRLLTAAWCRTRNEGVRILPAIDGQGFDVLYRRTSKLSRAECVDLSDFIMAWGSAKEVNWSTTSLAGQE